MIIKAFLLRPVLVALVLCAGCASAAVKRQYTFAEAADTVSSAIQSRAIQGTLAVTNVSSSSGELSSRIMRGLENSLSGNRDLSLVSRQKIDVALAEQKLGVSGLVVDTSAPRIGNLLGAKYILAGELSKNVPSLNIQVIETETSVLVYSHSFEIKDSELRNDEQAQKAEMARPVETPKPAEAARPVETPRPPAKPARPAFRF
jgi:PBP1b-binding outer membrane lipoprotein LpoB